MPPIQRIEPLPNPFLSVVPPWRIMDRLVTLIRNRCFRKALYSAPAWEELESAHQHLLLPVRMTRTMDTIPEQEVTLHGQLIRGTDASKKRLFVWNHGIGGNAWVDVLFGQALAKMGPDIFLLDQPGAGASTAVQSKSGKGMVFADVESDPTAFTQMMAATLAAAINKVAKPYDEVFLLAHSFGDIYTSAMAALQMVPKLKAVVSFAGNGSDNSGSFPVPDYVASMSKLINAYRISLLPKSVVACLNWIGTCFMLRRLISDLTDLRGLMLMTDQTVRPHVPMGGLTREWLAERMDYQILCSKMGGRMLLSAEFMAKAWEAQTLIDVPFTSFHAADDPILPAQDRVLGGQRRSIRDFRAYKIIGESKQGRPIVSHLLPQEAPEVASHLMYRAAMESLKPIHERESVAGDYEYRGHLIRVIDPFSDPFAT